MPEDMTDDENYELLRMETARKVSKLTTEYIRRSRYIDDDEFDLWCTRDMLGIFQFSFLKEHTDESDESNI